MAQIKCLFAFEHEVPSGHACTKHGHPCTEIVFSAGGGGTLHQDGRRYAYPAEGWFVYQPPEAHWIRQKKKGRHLCLGVTGCGAEDLAPGVYRDTPALRNWVRDARTALAGQDRAQRTRLELLSGLIVLGLQELKPGLAPNETRAERARALIDAHRHEPLSVADLASSLYVSPDYLRQLFRKTYGEGPIHYLVRKRIEMAAELLRDSTLPIQEVARRSGFNSAYYFSRLFKKMTGRTPSAYRRNFKN